MTGWDATRRVTLDPPWESFWLDIYEDPPVEDWLRIEEATTAALADPQIDAVRKACASIRPVIAAHNLTNRAGEPIEIDFDSMSVGLYRSVSMAILGVMQGTADAGPKPNRAQRRGTSSRASRSASRSDSGSSPKETPAST